MAQIQEITVSTKGGLIAALECARQGGIRMNRSNCHVDLKYVHDFDTLITLKRKSGNTTYYYKAGVQGRVIDRAKRLTKAMPASELLA